jgi:hypothetical protein
MPSLDLQSVPQDQRPTGAWAAALLHGLARDEAAGRRSPRLTEPNLDTWRRFRGRLTPNDLVALLFEDAAVLHPIPFDASTVGVPAQLDRLPAPLADAPGPCWTWRVPGSPSGWRWPSRSSTTRTSAASAIPSKMVELAALPPDALPFVDYVRGLPMLESEPVLR